MPRTQSVITVFVSSPSDLNPERTILESVIRELNITWGRAVGIALELVAWESHGRPGIGLDAQEVLNRQLPNDYDVFIGIMWTRFGTPTGRAGSGTEEEFNEALRRFKDDPDAINVMFYFKDEPVAPSKLDSSQLAKIGAFRSRLESEGVLHWPFAGDFEAHVRVHLAKELQFWADRVKATPAPAVSDGNNKAHVPVETEPQEEPGILEHFDDFTEGFATVRVVLSRMGAALETLTKKVEQRAAQQNQANVEHPGDLARVRQNADALTDDLDAYSAQIEFDGPEFGSLLHDSLQAFSMMITLSRDFGSDVFGSKQELRTTIADTIDKIRLTTDGITQFRNVVASLPRLTTRFNRSKRRAVSGIDRLLTELSNGQDLMRQILAAL